MESVLLVTGGAGFIGSNFVLDWFASGGCRLINVDKLTYAGNLMNLAGVEGRLNYTFVQGDIYDSSLMDRLLNEYRPEGIVNFAAETHVDRSISGPQAFLRTNIDGTFILLEAVRAYCNQLNTRDREAFRFVHVSTDEVYGTLAPDAPPFHEGTPYAPSSPYAASKAASDHLVRAWVQTYGLQAIVTNCSNNYGPFQFPEKLIPLVIANAVRGEALPVYGDGSQVRDWLYVEDHCSAIRTVLQNGEPGQTYNVGGNNQRTNLQVVTSICELLDELLPHSKVRPHLQLLKFVPDRPGHDRRYAIDASKIQRELGWVPKETFESGLRKTVAWYLRRKDWMTAVTTGEYRQWIRRNYEDRR